MKKVLSVVLAVAMVLACVASLAFVIGTQVGGTTATNSALQVEGFHVTDKTAMSTGVKVYADLVNLNDTLYDKNSVIYFALDLAVMNPRHLSNGVEDPDDETADLIFESDTVDFSLSAAPGGMVLYKPYYTGVAAISNLVNVVPNAAVNEKGQNYLENDLSINYQPDFDGNTMTISVKYSAEKWAWASTNSNYEVDLEYVSNRAGFCELNDTNGADNGGKGLYLYGISDDASVVKTDYTLVITGVTKGELDQEGLVTVSMQDKAGDTFEDDGVVYVTKNGHTYKISKFYATESNMKYVNGELKDSALNNTLGDFQWLALSYKGKNVYPAIYDVDNVAYTVRRLVEDEDNNVLTEDDNVWGIVGRFETEQVRYGSYFLDAEGKDVEGYGRSLGLDYWNVDTTTDTTGAWRGVETSSLGVYNDIYFINGDIDQQVYRQGLGSTVDYLYGGRNGATADDSNTTPLNQYGVTARQALEDLMADFGFGTGSNYSYKLQDSNFAEAATYEELGTATYNGNAIVIEQPEEDPDVEEGTDPGEIEEETPPEEDIPSEDIPDEEPTTEPVPETGDASAAVAVALTAAALVAAAGLAVVLKKAR